MWQEGQPLLGGLLGAADWVLAAAALTFLYIVYWQVRWVWVQACGLDTSTPLL